ncbi:MAG: hypothetical protein EB084_09985 [Proteobacteria bacterium]|nr:hypothetical protein [Pseudomonadota bacterium]
MGSFFGMLGNGDIVMNSVAWLAERTEQIAINRPEAKKQPITLDDVSRQRLSWFAMPFVPCIVAALGVMLLTMSRRY